MVYNSSRSIFFDFTCSVREAFLHLPKLVKNNGEKMYEPIGYMVVKWKVSSSYKGQTYFSIDMREALESCKPLEKEHLTLLKLEGNKICFGAVLHPKLSQKNNLDSIVYQKKILKLKFKLILTELDNCVKDNSITSELSLRKNDLKIPYKRSFLVATCFIDIRDLISGGITSHLVRLHMQRKGDYMLVDCVAENEEKILSREVLENVTNISYDMNSSNFLSSTFTSTSSNMSTSTTFSSMLATSSKEVFSSRSSSYSLPHNSNYVLNKVKSKKIIEESNESKILCSEINSCSLQKNDQDSLFNPETLSSISSSLPEVEGEEEKYKLKQNMEFIEKIENNQIMKEEIRFIVMAPILTENILEIYQFCDSSTQAVAQFHNHGSLSSSSSSSSSSSKVKPPFLSLVQVLNDGVGCEQQFTEKDILKLFNILFPQQSHPAALMPALHRGRHDTNYPSLHLWLNKTKTHPHVAYYSTEYNMRLRKEHCIPAEEYGIVVATSNRIIIHIMCLAPTAPIVGKDARLEFVIEIINGGLVRAVVFPCLPSKVKFLLGSKIALHMKKIENLLKETLHNISNLLSSNDIRNNSNFSSSSLQTIRREVETVKSENDLITTTSLSLDPNVWRDLYKIQNSSNVSFVEKTLRLLIQVDLPQPRICKNLLDILEQTICHYRNSVIIVLLVTETLMRMSDQRLNILEIAKESSTLILTLQNVYALYQNDSLFKANTSLTLTYENVKKFITSLEVSTNLILEKRKRELRGIRDVWKLLTTGVGDRQTTEISVGELQNERFLFSSQRQCRILHAALVLHMNFKPITLSIICILLHNYQFNNSPFFTGLSPLGGDFITSITIAMKIYRDNIINETHYSLEAYDNFLKALHVRKSKLTFFEKNFGSVVKEKPLFTCTVRRVNIGVSTEKISNLPLAITNSFFCIGSLVVPHYYLRKLEIYRHWWFKPALRLFIYTVSEISEGLQRRNEENEIQIIEIIVWERSELVSTILHVNKTIKVN